jgi:hypothetical protein
VRGGPFLPETGADTIVRTQLQEQRYSNRLGFRRVTWRRIDMEVACFRQAIWLESQSNVDPDSEASSYPQKNGLTAEERTRATTTIEGAEGRVAHRCRPKALWLRRSKQQ